jgi:hypothetical protein
MKASPERATQAVLLEVEDERRRQDVKWGQQNHSPLEWLAVLVEEIAEAQKPANHLHWHPDTEQRLMALCDYREEMVQIAAVAAAAIESIDRNELG